jgi:DUF438 domain-containing protein
MEENTNNEVQLTEEQIAENNRKAYEEAMAKIRAARIPLVEDTSTDTIQRIRCIKEVLDIKMLVPKYTLETPKGQQPFEKLTGSVELTLFPNYGANEQEQAFIQTTYQLMINRLVELVKTL